MTIHPVPEPVHDGSRADDAGGTTDQELVAALRSGDDSAYETLWIRHIAVARRVAARIAPTRAEDLVSEAFVSVYEQTRFQGKGPTSAFRPYLFAVMRNIAARWHREDRRVVYDPDADVSVEERGLHALEQEYDDALILGAFRSLPERWQRVLWLTDVEGVPRPQIADELKVRPNAVSALHRRARNGLRVQWLMQQVPADLARDDRHVASELPAVIVGGMSASRRHLASHLSDCARCAAVEQDLRAAYRVGRHAAASVGGLAALGVVLPTATTAWIAPVPIVTAAGLGLAAIGSAAAVLLGAVTVGIGVHLGAPAEPPEAVGPRAPVGDRAVDTHAIVESPAPEPALPPAVSAAPPPIEQQDRPDTIDFRWDGITVHGYPERPAPTRPAEPGTVVPPAANDDGAAVAPTVALTSPSSTYLAPVVSGTAPPGSEIAVAVGEDTYRVAPDETGAWSFDLRSLALTAGEHTAIVWTVTDGAASAPAEMSFTIEPLTLSGFDEYHPIQLRDAMSDGIVFTITGPPGGSVCIDSDIGQSAVVPLDGNGTAVRALRLFTYGIYVLRLTPCDGDFYGADVPRTVSVNEGLLDPWIIEDTPRWEISEP